MKKSFTYTCQSFLLHSMLTLMTAQATHATEQQMNNLDTLKHCGQSQEVRNVTEKTARYLIDGANCYFSKGIKNTIKVSEKSNKAAVVAPNKVVNNDQTIEYYEKVIQEAKPKSILVAHAQNQLGNMYRGKPYVNYKKAEQSYLSALSIYEKGDNNFFLAETNLNLAILYLDKQKAYDKAIENFNKAINCYSKEKTQNRKTKHKIAVSYFKLANAYQLQKKYELAIGTFNKAIPFYGALDDMLSVAKAKFNIALCNEKGEQRSLAEATYKEAKKLFEKKKEGTAYAAQCDKKLGDLCCMQEGREEEALYHYTAFYEASNYLSKKICAVERLVPVYLKLGEHEKIIKLQEKALVLLSNKYGKNSLEVADLYDYLGRAWYSAEQWNNCIKYHKEGLKIRKEKLNENDIDIAVSYTNLSAAYLQKGKYIDARKKANKAIEILETHKEKDNDMLMRNTLSLAYVYETEDNYNEAERHFNKAFNHCIAHYKLNDLHTAKMYEDKGMFYFRQNEMEQAYNMYKEALDIREKRPKDNAPELAKSYTTMGEICFHKGLGNDSIEFYNKAIQIFDETGKMPLDKAKAFNGRGSAYAEQKLYDQAIEDHKKAKSIFTNQSGKESEGVAVTCKLLGHCYNTKPEPEYEKAIESFNTALKIHQKLRASTEEIASDYHELGCSYSYYEKHEQAAKNHKRSLKKIEKYYGKESMEAAYKCADIATAYSHLGESGIVTAAPFYKRSLDIRKKHAKTITKLALKTGYLQMGVNSYRRKENKEAITHLTKYFEIQEANFPDKVDIDMVTSNALLSDSYFAEKKYLESITYAKKAIKMIRLPQFQGSTEMKKKEANLLYNMCRGECCLSRFTDALNHCQEALEIHEKKFGRKDQKVANDLYTMGMIWKSKAFLEPTNVETCYHNAIICFQDAKKICDFGSLGDLGEKCEEKIKELKDKQISREEMSLFMKKKIPSTLVFQE